MSVYLIIGGEDELKDDHEPNQGGLAVTETKGKEELPLTDEDREQKKA